MAGTANTVLLTVSAAELVAVVVLAVLLGRSRRAGARAAGAA